MEASRCRLDPCEDRSERVSAGLVLSGAERSETVAGPSASSQERELRAGLTGRDWFVAEGEFPLPSPPWDPLFAGERRGAAALQRAREQGLHFGSLRGTLVVFVANSSCPGGPCLSRAAAASPD